MVYESKDIHGYEFDFALECLQGEKSARKIIKPFRGDLIEKLNIKVGDYVTGRPMGAGCPVTHVLEVIKIDELSGILETWAVGPLISRKTETIEIGAYSMVGFEGIAIDIKKLPCIGKGASFLPSFCMLRLAHFGLVNSIKDTDNGLIVRIEDIHIFTNKFIKE